MLSPQQQHCQKQQVSSRHHECSPVLFNICVFQIQCHTVSQEVMWASHCCITNEAILGERFFKRVGPPLLSFVAIRDFSNEVKPAALDGLTIITLFLKQAWLSPLILKEANCWLFLHHDILRHLTSDCCWSCIECFYYSKHVRANSHTNYTITDTGSAFGHPFVLNNRRWNDCRLDIPFVDVFYVQIEHKWCKNTKQEKLKDRCVSVFLLNKQKEKA